ncbi:MAG TPA: hypothetical protein VN458_08025 [Solirubrobacterales bacterium]|nr:hypothetical protein [Solirubrobacterales bacterium]
MACRRSILAVLLAVLALVAGGCGSGGSTSDDEIVSALDLKQSGAGYEIAGDPFCTVDELLNDADEVDAASGDGGDTFVIASPDAEIGVLARRPFAPDCTRQARAELERLGSKSD